MYLAFFSRDIVLHQNEAMQQPAVEGGSRDWGDASDEELDFSQPVIIPRQAASPARADTNASLNARPMAAALPHPAVSQSDRRRQLLQAMSASAGMSLEEAQHLGEDGLRELEFPIGARRSGPSIAQPLYACIHDGQSNQPDPAPRTPPRHPNRSDRQLALLKFSI